MLSIVRPLAFCCGLILAVSACTSSMNSPGNDPAAASAAIAAAIADPRRPESDRARDADRNPQAILEFAGLAPGQSVVDLFAGAGYYTELAAYVVGPEGRVLSYNNTGYSRVAAKGIAARYADGRLAQVEQLVSENNALQLPVAAFDIALFILSYHDVYYLDGDRGWVLIDRPKLLKTLYAAMKSGGRVVVADHVSRPGLTAEQGKALHRIDPDLIKADFLAAGFRFDGETEVLRNATDNLDVIAMAPTVRGKTDRAVLRFVKP